LFSENFIFTGLFVRVTLIFTYKTALIFHATCIDKKLRKLKGIPYLYFKIKIKSITLG
jgi:hypothetical protein